MIEKDTLSRLTVLTVTHNSGQVIGGLLRTIPKEATIIIIDNASTDDTIEIVRKITPQAKLILNEVGLGYGNGMNCGLRKVETEFAFLVNPDSVLTDQVFLSLIQAADDFPKAGLLGPTLLNPDGTVELSHDVRLFSRSAYGKRTMEIPPEGPVSTEFLSGASMLLRMEAGQKVGFFDPEIFLYYEDDDMCMRLRDAGYGIVLVPDAIVTHIGGGSVRPNRAYYWEKFWHIAWSRLYFEKKYRGSAQARKLALARTGKYALKSVGNILAGNRAKSWRDAARCAGSFAFFIGRRATDS